MSGLLTVTAIFLAVFAILGAPAWASGDAGAAAITVPIPPELVALLIDHLFELVVVPAVLWLLRRSGELLKVKRDDLLVARLEAALLSGLDYAREMALREGADLKSVEVRDKMVADAATYLLPKIPGVMHALDITPKGLSDRLHRSLPVVAPLSLRQGGDA